jgi:glycosyltransferase involved in cell wall biosynthesis
MTLPCISIVTPNLNYGRFLPRTLRSVLDQDYPALDYIVIDGGSTDDSVRILEAHATAQMRWEMAAGLGQYESINRGFSQASGEILGWINSDDIYFPWTLRTVAAIFGAFPNVDWIIGAPSVIQDDAVQEVSQYRPFSQEALALGLYTGGPFGLVQQESCFWRRRLWERAGPLRDRQTCGLAADFDLWTRFARHAELVACSALLGGFSIHSANRSRVQQDRYGGDVARVIAGLPNADRTRRNVLARWHRRYLKLRPFIGLKGLIRRLGGLIDFEGPVIRRDAAAEQFVLTRERVFP